MSAPRLHPFWRLVLAAIGVLVAAFVVRFVGFKVLEAQWVHLGLGPRPSDERDVVKQLAQAYGLPLTLLSYPLALGFLFWFRTRIDKYTWRSLGFSKPRAIANFARGALTALLTLSVLFGLMWLAGAVRFGGWSSDVLSHSALYSLGALLLFGAGFGAVGFFEETLFRGYGLANLHQWLGWRGAVAVQAVVFAAIHLVNGIGKPDVLQTAFAAMPSIALIAWFFALSYRKTGSLWFPIGFHVAWNWLLGCVFSLPVSGIPTFRLFDVQASGTSILTGGSFGAESSFFLIPLLLAMIYALSLAPDHPRARANLNAPEPTQSADFVPTPVPIAEPVASIEEPEESRENRYNSRFGSAQGFDSDTLRELKQMQDARDEADRQKSEALRAARREEELRLEEVRRAQIAAQAATVVATQGEPVATEKVAEAPAAVEVAQIPAPVAVETKSEVVETTPIPVETAVEVAPTQRPSLEPRRPSLEPRRPSLEPRRTATPPPVATPETPAAPPAEPTDAPPKKARPRW